MTSATRDGWIRLPIIGMPKARPKFNSVTRQVYMPEDYTQWKHGVSDALVDQGIHAPYHEDPMKLKAVFGEDYIEFQLFPVEGHRRAKHVTADIDNLAGGLMDALEQGQVIKNDKLIVRLDARVAGRIRD
jgi:Holliday junction resolvase RusA-like endonuclease